MPMKRKESQPDEDVMSFNSKDDSNNIGVPSQINTMLNFETPQNFSTPVHTGMPIQRVADGEAFKAIVVGNAEVGKTRMTYLFVNNQQLSDDKKETIGKEKYSKTIMFGGLDKVTKIPVTKSIRVSFYDSAGQEKFDAITASHYRNAMGALIAYSVTDRKSFQAVEKWIEQVHTNAGPNCSIVIVANKTDVPFNERDVTLEEGDQLAEKHGLEFYEVSV